MFLQVFLTPTHLAIAMEYAQGGDLFNVRHLTRMAPPLTSLGSCLPLKLLASYF